jgi:hypothetical protein
MQTDITTEQRGKLKEVIFPDQNDASVFYYDAYKQRGDLVRPAETNGDRIAFVVTRGLDRKAITESAERFVANTRIILDASSGAAT